MKQDRITVRLPTELRSRLAAAARRKGVRESDLVRGAVERQLEAEDSKQTAYDLTLAAGVIGIVHDAKPDLSTNKKHFDKFGSL